MAERVETAASDAEFNSPNANSMRLKVLLSITPATGLQQQLLHRLAVAQEMMNTGRFTRSPKLLPIAKRTVRTMTRSGGECRGLCGE